MNEDLRDQLDIAIDRVASRLVSVEPDVMMAERIASRLPEPSRRRVKLSSVNWTWLVPQLAAAAGVALLAFVLFSNRSTDVGGRVAVQDAAFPPSAPSAPVAPAAPAAPASMASRKTPVMTLVDDTFDRDFGLDPIVSPQQIVVGAIAEAPSIDVPTAQVAPIVLTDLPLASESPSPR